MSSLDSRDEETSLASRATVLCRELGYDTRPTFYSAVSSFDREENLHVVTVAFDVIGVHSVFGISEGASSSSFKPVVYVGIAENKEDAARLHRRIWTQGAVPYLVVVTSETVQLRNALEPPGTDVTEYPFQPGASLDFGLAKVSAAALSSSIYWRDFSTSRASAVDTRLVTAIEDLNQYVRGQYPALNDKRGLLNALIGHLLYLYVLIDRKIVSSEWMANVIKASSGKGTGFASEAMHQGVRATELPFGQDEVWAVLDGIDELINGSVFPISMSERRILPETLIHLVHRVIRCGDIIYYQSRQVSFIDISFETLRTETISAIYERFLKVEGGASQRKDGAFYTPPFLADYVVSCVDRELPLTTASRVLDPACGSGVFLVSAYRRIMEQNNPHGGWAPAYAMTARSLLISCIHGIEKNAQAVNICRFSLYLTMLDYVGRTGIENLSTTMSAEKLLPSLDRNIIVSNAFQAKLSWLGRFTHVVGNPPWAQPSRQRYGRNRGTLNEAVRDEPELDSDRDTFAVGLSKAYHIAHGRVSDLFVWLVHTRFLEDGGVLGLVLPTRSLVGRQSGKFATAFAEMTSIRLVANLTYLRYRLFSGARSPATVVVARKSPPTPLDRVTVYRPRLCSLPVGRTGHVWSILVSQTDLYSVRSRDLCSDTNGWLSATMLGVFDRRMREALAIWSANDHKTLGGLLTRSGLRIQRGGDPGETGVPLHNVSGQMKPSGLFRLDKKMFNRVSETYRPLFSAGVVLVPRNFRNARLLDEPHAYRSTYYAIAPAHRREAPRRGIDSDWAAALETVQGDERLGLLGLVAFLNSGVASYFASLFGAAFLMENARLEKGDISTLPCPYESTRTSGLQALATAADVDDRILDAMKAGSDLRVAVKEYMAFNKGFADAQLPDTAYDNVSAREIDDFVDRFSNELRGQFTKAHSPRVIISGQSGGIVALQVGFGDDAESTTSEDIAIDGTFVASSVIAFDHGTRIGRIAKSEARFAWMADQAVADAEALGRILRNRERGTKPWP